MYKVHKLNILKYCMNHNNYNSNGAPLANTFEAN